MRAASRPVLTVPYFLIRQIAGPHVDAGQDRAHADGGDREEREEDGGDEFDEGHAGLDSTEARRTGRIGGPPKESPMTDEYNAEAMARAEQEIEALRFEVEVIKVAFARLIAQLSRRNVLDADDIESAADSTEEKFAYDRNVMDITELAREIFDLRPTRAAP